MAHPQADKLQHMIDGFEQIIQGLPELLPGLPSAQNRLRADIQRSVNYLKHLNGVPGSTAGEATRQFGPINLKDKFEKPQEQPKERSFGPIQMARQRTGTDESLSKPNTAFDIDRQPAPTAQQLEMEQLQKDVNAIYPTFMERESDELLDSLTELQLRGVAKKAGMTVTEEDPDRLTVAFVNEVKEAIRNKEAANLSAATGHAANDMTSTEQQNTREHYNQRKEELESQLRSLYSKKANLVKNKGNTAALDEHIATVKDDLETVVKMLQSLPE